jgi:hypothetical protein
MSSSQSQSYNTTDSQSASLGPATNFSLLFSGLTIVGFLMWGILSDEGTDL